MMQRRVGGYALKNLSDDGFQDIDVPSLIFSSKNFVAGFTPPDYFLDGVLQRRFLYSLTAPTGAGKTAILLLLAAHAAQGLPLGDREIAQGRVIYLAGENPDDIRMRWLAMAQHLGFDANTIDVHFIPGTPLISECFHRIEKEVLHLGGAALVIIDTSAAYFEGDGENDNVQMGDHGRLLRRLATLPGGPCVIAACHPTKAASDDNLLPRGGGAFLAEVDGNLVGRKTEKIVDLHWQGKFRGAEFEPISFEIMRGVRSDVLKDSKGRHIPTVMARALSDAGRDKLEADAQRNARKDQDALLSLMANRPGGSISSMAESLGWLSGLGKPQKSRLHRAMLDLRDAGLVEKDRGDQWSLTKKGRAEAKAT